MAIVAALLAMILVIVMVMYFRQFSRLQDVTEDRSLLTIANHSLTTQRDNWIANYEKLSASAAQHSKTLVSILDFLMEEAKVDPQWVLEKGGLDKGVMEYVHSLKSGLKAEQQVSTDYKEIIDKLRARREKLLDQVAAVYNGCGFHAHSRTRVQGDAMLARIATWIEAKRENLQVQEPDTGTTLADSGYRIPALEHSDPRADVSPGLDPSLRGEAVLAAASGAHGDEA